MCRSAGPPSETSPQERLKQLSGTKGMCPQSKGSPEGWQQARVTEHERRIGEEEGYALNCPFAPFLSGSRCAAAVGVSFLVSGHLPAARQPSRAGPLVGALAHR